MMFKSQWCRRLGDLQVLVHPRLLLRTAMVVAVAGDVTLDLWAPLLEAQGTDPSLRCRASFPGMCGPGM